MQTGDETADILIDTKWFQDQLKDRRISQRELGRRTSMDPSSVSLLLQGKRRMRAEQAAEIARVLDVSVAMVIQKAGITLDEHTGSGKLVRLIGTIDAESKAVIEWGSDKHQVPVDFPVAGTHSAVRWNTMHTPSDMNDGWIGIVGPKLNAGSTNILDRTGLVEVEGQGVFLAQVRRGYNEGRYTLVRQGHPPIHDAVLGWFAPLVLVIPR